MPTTPAAEDDPLARMESSPFRGTLALAALCLTALLPTLMSPFFGDDYFHIERAGQLGEALTSGWVLPIGSVGAWWTPPGLAVEYFRPAIVLSFAVDRLLYGTHAFGYHFSNLLLHLATTLLVWRVATRVLGRGFAAWAAAALFAIHPAHAVAIGWISGRTDVLATMFYMAAFASYLEARARRLAAGRARTVGWLAVSCVLFAIALLSKEMAITLPAVVLLHALLVPEAGASEDAEPLVPRLAAPCALGLVAVAYLVLRLKVLGGFHAPPQPFAYHFGDPGLIFHLATAPFLYLADLVMFVPPDPVGTLPFWTAHPALLIAFLTFILFVFAGTLRKAPARSIALWGLGWTAITLLPVLMLTVGEHFLYLPSIGYCILVASQLPAAAGAVAAKERRSLAIVAALVTVVCFGRTAMFTWFSRTAARTIDEAVAAIDTAPRAKTILVEDLPASAALAFPHAVRLARPDRQLEIEILSLAPRVLPAEEDISTVAFESPDRFVLRRPSGYINSYLERALRGPPAAFRPGEEFDRDGYKVTVLEAGNPFGQLRAFEVSLSDRSRTLLLGPRQNGQNGLAALAPATP